MHTGFRHFDSLLELGKFGFLLNKFVYDNAILECSLFHEIAVVDVAC